jgi:molybdopterin biosynthesis enzyme MoaB
LRGGDDGVSAEREALLLGVYGGLVPRSSKDTHPEAIQHATKRRMPGVTASLRMLGVLDGAVDRLT